MKYSSLWAAFLLPLLSVLTPARAAAAVPPPAGPAPVGFDGGKGVLEFIERLRFEDRQENFDFNAAAHSPTDDGWFVQRFRVGLTWQPSAAFSLQVQVQDAREWGAERPTVPFILGAEGDDALDLRLAALTWGDPKKDPLVFTLGRQILALGEERLVGVGEWNNFSRTFDAGKLVWNVAPGRTTATFFLGSVVYVQGTTLGEGWKFNHSTANDLFGGAYVTHKLDKTRVLDGYLLWRDKQDSSPIYHAPTTAIPVAARVAAPYDIGQNITTLGSRYLAPPAEGRFDAEFEAAYQWGEVVRQTTTATGPYAGSSPRLDHQAWAAHALVGYTPQGAPGKLRFDVEYNAASGDTDRTDGTNGSFMSLFPSNHKFYGFMDVMAWKNMREVVATLRFTPVAQTMVRIDYHQFSLSSNQDAWYRANGVATVRPLNAAAQSAPRSAGSELDLTLTWTPRPWAAIDVGYARFFAGDYLGATGAKSDADFVYLQSTLKL